MTESNVPPEVAPAPKRSRPVWLIVLIVVLVVCCCCAAMAVPIAWFTGDSVLKTLGLAQVAAFAFLA